MYDLYIVLLLYYTMSNKKYESKTVTVSLDIWKQLQELRLQESCTTPQWIEKLIWFYNTYKDHIKTLERGTDTNTLHAIRNLANTTQYEVYMT